MCTIVNTSAVLRVLDVSHSDAEWNGYLGLQCFQRQVIQVIILLIIIVRHLFVDLCTVIDAAAVLGVLHMVD